jgi:sulfate transport system permease protein
VAAFAMASLLALLSLVTLVLKTFLEWKLQKQLRTTIESSTLEV